MKGAKVVQFCRNRCVQYAQVHPYRLVRVISQDAHFRDSRHLIACRFSWTCGSSYFQLFGAAATSVCSVACNYSHMRSGNISSLNLLLVLPNACLNSFSKFSTCRLYESSEQQKPCLYASNVVSKCRCYARRCFASPCFRPLFLHTRSYPSRELTL